MHWPIRSPEAWDATNERPASLYQSQNPGCTRLIWSHTIQHFPWHHKNAETRIRNEEGILSCGKIEIYLIGQIYPTGTDTSPHNSLLRHISSQGRNLETFLEMVNFLDKRRKKCIHSNTLIVSDGANFQGAKTQDTRVWAREFIRGSLNKPKSTKRAF